MKKFNLEEAKKGAKLCTRDGKKVEVLKWNLRNDYPILGVVKFPATDEPMIWTLTGALYRSDYYDIHDYDLMMEE